MMLQIGKRGTIEHDSISYYIYHSFFIKFIFYSSIRFCFSLQICFHLPAEDGLLPVILLQLHNHAVMQ